MNSHCWANKVGSSSSHVSQNHEHLVGAGLAPASSGRPQGVAPTKILRAYASRLLWIGTATLCILLFLATPVHAEITSKPTGDLLTERTGHTATLLNDGSVLVVGGNTNGGPATAELYLPASSEWIQVGSPEQRPRSGHTATILPDGRVLIVGGYSANTPLALAELYDPATRSWQPTGSLNTARDEHTMSILSDGRVLVMGGYSPEGDALRSVEMYNPATGMWTLMNSGLTTPRYDHTSTVLPGDKILVVGGISDDAEQGEIPLATVEMYDHATQTWRMMGSLNAARYSHVATPQINGGVFIAGGNDGAGRLASTEQFDPATGRWTTLAPLNTARSGHTTALSVNGGVLVIGGLDSSGRLAKNEFYRPSDNSWITTGDLVIARNGHSATVLNGTTVLVAGGSATSGETLASVELFTPQVGVELVNELALLDKTHDEPGDTIPVNPPDVRSFDFNYFMPFVAK